MTSVNLEVGFNRKLLPSPNLASGPGQAEPALLSQGFAGDKVGNPVRVARHLVAGSGVRIAIFDLEPGEGLIVAMSASFSFARAHPDQGSSPVDEGQLLDSFTIFRGEKPRISKVFEKDDLPVWFLETGGPEDKPYPKNQMQKQPRESGADTFILKNVGVFYFSMSLKTWSEGEREPQSFRVDPEMIVDHGG